MNNRIIKLITLDIIGATLALYVSFLLRFEFEMQYGELFIYWLPWFILIQTIVFYFMGLYARIWRYTSLFDLFAILSSISISWLIASIGVLFVMGTKGYPRSIFLIYLLSNTIITVASRISVRVYYSYFKQDVATDTNHHRKSLLLIGAGKTGDKIAREILTTSRNHFSIAGFVDDDPNKQGAMLQGVKILCGVNNINSLKINYDELLITAPSASGDQMRRIVNACKKTGKKYKTVPALNEIIDGEISLAVVRDVSYADLLGREEVKLDMNSIEDMLQGKRILITGAGGSIGSELVKQCLSFDPVEIICLDISEEKIYKIGQQFSELGNKTVIKPVLATINNKKHLEKVFLENRPQIVFHAAAFKHVPIQENHPWTAVNTNIGGTMNLAEISDKYFVDKFVLVSTDKAVNPVNVMGATKRVAEKLILSFNMQSKTCFSAVRFGNVLGSSGSAIPTFQKQINNGGPITITHPEMTRYFMSIQEASQLILQCGALARDGEIFLLKMGKPIKIVQIAKDLIRISGFEPDIDIPIVYIGLRPGEKLYEELKSYGEKKINTEHKKIMILKEEKNYLPWKIFKKNLEKIILAAQELNPDEIQFLLKQIIPNYNPRSFESVIENNATSFIGIKGEA